MVLPDVNILIGAFRADASHHELCRSWLASVLGSQAAFALSPLTLSALVRVTTNPRIYREPSTSEDAFGFCDDLRRQPRCQLVEPGECHWEIFARLCREAKVVAGDVTDAWYAALAIESGCEWVTLDRDFSRFPGLRWSVPHVQA